MQLQDIRQKGNSKKDQHALEQLLRPAVSDEAQYLIEDIGNDQDIQYVGEEGDALLRVQQVQLHELSVGQLVEFSGIPADPGKSLVVKDHQTVIGGELHIQLHAVSRLHRPAEGGQGVFRDARGVVVEAPVGDIVLHEGAHLLPVPVPGPEAE